MSTATGVAQPRQVLVAIASARNSPVLESAPPPANGPLLPASGPLPSTTNAPLPAAPSQLSTSSERFRPDLTIEVASPVHAATAVTEEAAVCCSSLSAVKALRKLAVPIEMFYDLALMPSWMVTATKIEAVVFLCVSLPFQLYVILSHGGADVGIAFIPLVLHRAIMFFVDIGSLGAQCGWANAIMPDMSTGASVARLLRVIDGIGCLFTLLIGAFMTIISLVFVTDGGSTRISMTTAAVPIWLSSAIQLCILVIFSAPTVLHAVYVDWPLDLIWRFRAAPIPGWRLFMSRFASRVLIIACNALTVPLALKIDAPAGAYSWDFVFNGVFALIAIVAACVGMLFVAICAHNILVSSTWSRVSAAIARSPNVPERPAAWDSTLDVTIQSALLYLAVILACVAVAAIAARSALVNYDASFELIPLDQSAIVMPCLVTTVMIVLLTWIFLGVQLQKWRKVFMHRYGVTSPATAAEARAIAAASQQLLNHALAASPAPTQLVRIGMHRYRRVREGDDLEALRKSCFESPNESRERLMRQENKAAAGTSSTPDRWTVAHELRRTRSAYYDLNAIATSASQTNARIGPNRTLSLSSSRGFLRQGYFARQTTSAAFTREGTCSAMSGTNGDDTSVNLRPQRCPDTPHTTCSVCMAAEADAVALECGHGGLCTACGMTILYNPRPNWQRCPLCRAPMIRLVRIVPPREQTSVLVDVLLLPAREEIVATAAGATVAMTGNAQA